MNLNLLPKILSGPEIPFIQSLGQFMAVFIGRLPGRKSLRDLVMNVTVQKKSCITRGAGHAPEPSCQGA